MPKTDSARQFILACLRSRWAPDALDQARRLAQTGLDWDTLEPLIHSEGLAGLLYQQVREQGITPEPVERRLAHEYYRRASRNTLLQHEVETILAALNQAGVSVILLKGLALAATVYHHIALRQIGDVDLLIRREDIAAVDTLLTKRGYQRDQVETWAGDLARHESHATWRRAGPVEVILEPHWSLLDSPHHQAKGVAWFWQTARPARLGQTTVDVLGPEAQLLHLCAHAWLHHSRSSLSMRWLHDVAELLVLYEKEFDWPDLFTQAQVYDLVLPLQYALKQVLEDWQLTLASEVAGALWALQPSADETRVYGHLTTSRSVVARFWADLWALSGWQRRLLFAAHQVFPSVAYMRHRYHIHHQALLPLYYPYRWYRGLRGLK